MTLWNIIRDFFVQYVFGGVTSNGDSIYGTSIGITKYFVGGDIGFDGSINETSGLLFPFEGLIDDFNYGYFENSVIYMSLGDWLSTTATIITLVGLFIAITLLIISLFKWIVRLVSLRG